MQLTRVKFTLCIYLILQYSSILQALIGKDCTRKNLTLYNVFPYKNHLYIKTLSGCQELCLKDKGCNHFDYSLSNQKCLLYKETVDKVYFDQDNNYETGPKICDDTMEVRIHSNRKQILKSGSIGTIALTVMKCREMCFTNSYCKSWVHLDNLCYLYDYPLYMNDIEDKGANLNLFYGMNTQSVGVYHDYGETQPLQNDVCLLNLSPEKPSRVGVCNKRSWIQILQNKQLSQILIHEEQSKKYNINCINDYIVVVNATGIVYRRYPFDLSRFMSFKCNGKNICEVPSSLNVEIELSYSCEPSKTQRFISDPKSFIRILEFGLRQLKITAIDKKHNIFSASYGIVGNDGKSFVFAGFNGSKALDIFQNIPLFKNINEKVYKEAYKGFQFLMTNYVESYISLSPRYPSFILRHSGIEDIYCGEILDISLCKFRYPREKGIKGLKSSFGNCDTPYIVHSNIEKYKKVVKYSQCEATFSKTEWRVLMTGTSTSTLSQAQSTLKNEFWRYRNQYGNSVFTIIIEISYINSDFLLKKLRLRLRWSQSNSIYESPRKDVKIFRNDLRFFKGNKYWKAFTGLSSRNSEIPFGDIFYLDDIGQYSDEEVEFTLYGNYYPNVDGNYSIHGWSECINYSQNRILKCDNPSKAYNGRNCIFPEPEKRSCGLWEPWGSWSACNGTMKTRKRICKKQILTAEDCVGPSTNVSKCLITKNQGLSTTTESSTLSSTVSTITLKSTSTLNVTTTLQESTTLKISTRVTSTTIPSRKRETTTAIPFVNTSRDPISITTHTERSCTQYQPWSKCSVSCGIRGVKRRILQCGTNLKIDSEECSTEICPEG